MVLFTVLYLSEVWVMAVFTVLYFSEVWVTTIFTVLRFPGAMGNGGIQKHMFLVKHTFVVEETGGRGVLLVFLVSIIVVLK